MSQRCISSNRSLIRKTCQKPFGIGPLSWSGGCIELHSKPRHPEFDEIKSFLPLFNRAVIFETSEYSWPGFSAIRLPQGKKHLSRKSSSIYLYTKDRPAEEEWRFIPRFTWRGHFPVTSSPAKFLREATTIICVACYLTGMVLSKCTRSCLS